MYPSVDDPTRDSGIAALGVQLPSLALDVRELAELRGVDPDKFTLGLGCDTIAWCAPEEDVVTLATGAARRAIARWGGRVADIGLLAVGTETARDMSRPLSAFVADELRLVGAYRSYEVKHACYGGTVALRQALEWRWSGASRGKAALVIAADVARYTPGGPAEPTQGAGAVAMVVDDARVASVDRVSHTWARPAFDFWRPVGNPWPEVAGKLSLDCYNEATIETFRQMFGGRPVEEALSELVAIAMHVPFPKMVRKAIAALGDSCGLDAGTASRIFETMVLPALSLHPKVGNSYTASLWMGVATALAGRSPGERLAAFSYGSGFGSELMTLSAGPQAAAAPWMADIEHDLSSRRRLPIDVYDAERRAELARYA